MENRTSMIRKKNSNNPDFREVWLLVPQTQSFSDRKRQILVMGVKITVELWKYSHLPPATSRPLVAGTLQVAEIRGEWSGDLNN